MKKIVLLLTAANLLDYITTAVGLRMGFVEYNSVVAGLSSAAFLALKLGIVASLIAMLILAYRYRNVPVVRGIYVGLVVGICLSSLLIAAIGIHNTMLILGFGENAVFVKMMSSLLSALL